MKKIILFFFVVLYLNISSSTIAWESNVKIGCINENLEPCSSTESSSNISASNSDKDLDKKIKIIKKKKSLKRKITI